MKKILITGGAGFIGSHAARSLLARGDDITLLDDFNNRYDPRLKEMRVHSMFTDLPVRQAGGPTPPVVRGDIRDQALVNTLFQESKFQQVIHLAAWASVQPSIENPHVYTEVNLDGTVNILEAARKNGVENIVFASSSSVYGGLSEVPFKETANIMRPISPYAATKAAGEILCATWYNMYQLPITALRFFTVYGPWGRPEMAMFKFAEAIRTNQPVYMRGATTQRDFTYVEDIVQGITGALDNPHGFAVYNLGEHDAVPLPRLIAAIENAMQKKAQIVEVPLPPGDIPATLADITKAQAEIGYKPRIHIEAGVAAFISWYQEVYLPAFVTPIRV